jgi:hypothetical protein
MARLLAGTVRPLVRAALSPGYDRFLRSLEEPALAQERCLRAIVEGMAATEYGRSLRLESGDGVEAFRAKVPAVGYDELAPWLERQRREPGARVLAPEPVRFFEKTSGSSGSAKYIPYTRGLLGSFSRMASHWFCDLLTHGPRFRTGMIYMSVSPALREEPGVGLEDDSGYLSGFLGPLVRSRLAVSTQVKRLGDSELFHRVTCAQLASCRGLEIVFVWNPSLFEGFLDWILEHREQVASDLARGRVECAGLRFELPARAGSRERLEAVRSGDFGRIWPELKLLSAWDEGASRLAAERLRARLPSAFFQGKGLLATEAPVTLPLLAGGVRVPLVDELFLEFEDESGVRSVHELEDGKSYSLLISQRGGLLRYRLGDTVRASGRVGRTPGLEFLGRASGVSDLVGEKLSDSFVAGALGELARSSFPGGVAPWMALAPSGLEERRPGYVLVVDGPAGALGPALDAALSAGHHYRYARWLGQLREARVVSAPGARDAYFAVFLARGMRLGDIKPGALVSRAEDARELFARLGLRV